MVDGGSGEQRTFVPREPTRLLPLTPSLSYVIESACNTMWDLISDTIIRDFTLDTASGKAREIGVFLIRQDIKEQLLNECKDAVEEEINVLTMPEYIRSVQIPSIYRRME